MKCKCCGNELTITCTHCITKDILEGYYNYLEERNNED